jgi:hypothetical protein
MGSDGPAKTPPPKTEKLFGFAFATMGEHQSAGAVFIPLARLMSSGAVSGRDSDRVEVQKSRIRMMAQARFITNWPAICRPHRWRHMKSIKVGLPTGIE